MMIHSVKILKILKLNSDSDASLHFVQSHTEFLSSFNPTSVYLCSVDLCKQPITKEMQVSEASCVQSWIIGS